MNVYRVTFTHPSLSAHSDRPITLTLEVGEESFKRAQETAEARLALLSNAPTWEMHSIEVR